MDFCESNSNKLDKIEDSQNGAVLADRIFYLQSVLGVDEYFTKSKSKAKNFLVYSPFSLSTLEQELVNKMLNSIGISSALYINQENFNSQKISEDESFFGLSFGITPPKNLKVTWLELPAISRFINESDGAKVNEVKRLAWTQLKILKSKIEKQN